MRCPHVFLFQAHAFIVKGPDQQLLRSSRAAVAAAIFDLLCASRAAVAAANRTLDTAPLEHPPFCFAGAHAVVYMQKFRLNLVDVSHGSTFHRCVYILVAQEAAIMQAGQLSRQEYGMEGDYMPHVSLLYADLGPEAVHQSQQAAVQRLYGEGSDYSTLLTDTGFTADAITVWHTPAEDKSLSSWKQIAEFPLQD
jgi:hypothetical protein